MGIMDWLRSVSPKPTQPPSRKAQADAVYKSRTKRQKAIAGDRSYSGYKGRAVVKSTASAPYNAPMPKARGTKPTPTPTRNPHAPNNINLGPVPDGKRVYPVNVGKTPSALASQATTPEEASFGARLIREKRPVRTVVNTSPGPTSRPNNSPSKGPVAGKKPKRKVRTFKAGRDMD